MVCPGCTESKACWAVRQGAETVPEFESEPADETYLEQCTASEEDDPRTLPELIEPSAKLAVRAGSQCEPPKIAISRQATLE
jgi:hypothetical protein